MTLTLRASLANTGNKSENESFLQMIAEQVPVYRYNPQPFEIRAALDWLALLGTSADIIAISQALWRAYEVYIKPKLGQDPKSNAMIVVNITSEDGSRINCVLGNSPIEYDMFIKEFRHSVTELSGGQLDGADANEKFRKFEESERYIRVKSRKVE